MIFLKSPQEIEIMSQAGQIVAEVMRSLKEVIRVGATTKEIERFADNQIRSLGGKSAFKGYRGYPSSICASINEEVVHGIPSSKKLREGDSISIDLGVLHNGFFGDAAYTFPVGKIDEETALLMKVTEEALYCGIDKAVVGNRVSDISHAIQQHAEQYGFSVVKTFVGHGIGRQLHEEPQVPNFGPPGQGPRLRQGMTLAIEPMVNAGTFEVKVLEDGWTAVTADGKRSAHFEHTVVIMPDRARILTKFN
ncbi:MAG: type I methionyl aminopeptidase [Nitrospirae bacterium]|nr:type I methionyl aminopeptidase [Nitrospirota bacterium]